MSKLLTPDKLHDYQRRCVELVKEKPFCALWLDMGLGKTVSSATAFADLMESFDVGRVLIIAPKTVAATTWPTELQSWTQLSHLRFSVMNGSPTKRTQALITRADVHIISRDNLLWLVQAVGDQWPWDMVILDESSSFKSQDSNRWKAIRAARKYISRMVQLSATPAPNGLKDLWAPFYLLDRGKRLGETERAFKARWFIENRERHMLVPKANAKDEIYAKVDDITTHMSAEDYLEMPDLIINKIWVEMPTKAKNLYDKFEREAMLTFDELGISQTEIDEIEDEAFETEALEACNAAVLTGKLLQFSNGAIYYDSLQSYKKIHDVKIDALKDIVNDNPYVPVLVAYSFKSDLKRLKKAFPKAVVMDDDPNTQVRWNNGEISMLLTHPASSGHGLNLQHGSNILIWFGLTWSLELYLQLIGRLYRQGQDWDHVIVHLIMCKGTVESRVINVLTDKNATQQDLLDAVKI